MHNLYQLKCFEDNYIFIYEENQKLLIVDPGDSRVVLEFVQKNNFKIDSILLTHGHADHIGGLDALVEYFEKQSSRPNAQSLNVYGHKLLKGQLSSLAQKYYVSVQEAEQIHFESINLKVLEVPGHTTEHIAFFDEANLNLFSGDVIFSLGCGRKFTGTYEQMYHSLQRIAKLPVNTKIFCSHEYTLKNCEFYLELQQKIFSSAKHDGLQAPSVLDLRLLRRSTLATPQSLDLRLLGPFAPRASRIRKEFLLKLFFHKIGDFNRYNELYNKIKLQLSQTGSTIPTILGFELENNLFLTAPNLEAFIRLREQRNK